MFQLSVRGLSACCWSSVSSVQDGLDAAGFVTALADSGVLAGTAGLTGCASPVAGSASTHVIATTDATNPGDQRHMCQFEKTACTIIAT